MHDQQTQARALELYQDTGTIAEAALIMKAEGTDVDETTIHRVSQALEGFTSRLQGKRKEQLANAWFGVAIDGARRMTTIIKELPGNQTAVPAAIATDKYLKLTEEAPTASSTNISVFVGVKVD